MAKKIAQLPAARTHAQPQEPRTFDIDAWHAMQDRDDDLIRDEVINGAMANKFVYRFNIPGSGDVSGVSVIGARHLARHYGGLKHRIVATAEKTGPLFRFTTYPAEGVPMSVHVSRIPELEGDPDGITVVIEVQDIKTGNTVQMERTEERRGKKRDGGTFERPNYATIAQSKAYRNAVLALVPQDVLLAFKSEAMKLGQGVDITEDVLREKRRAVLQYCAKNGIAIARDALQALGLDQIAGLRQAIESGRDAFERSLASLGLVTAKDHDAETGEVIEQPSRIEHQPEQSMPMDAADKPKQMAKARNEPAPEQESSQELGFE